MPEKAEPPRAKRYAVHCFSYERFKVRLIGIGFRIIRFPR